MSKTSSTLQSGLAASPVIPVVVIEEVEHAVPVARALLDGGINVAEFTLRTACAADAIAAVAAAVPEIALGAGTVLNVEQYRAAVAAGARFIVSPGLDEALVETALADDVPIYPGIATATELQRAWNMGVRVVKFFPAGQAGGIPMLEALSAVFRDMEFVPTGGVSASNLADYLAVPAVVACGGSWLTPGSAMEAGSFGDIAELAREALRIGVKRWKS